VRNRHMVLTAVLAAVVSGGAAQAAMWTIPGTVNASGLNGTRFVSDLAVTNPGSLPVSASLALVPANGALPAQMLLNPGQTIVSRNVLQQLWGASGAAATAITASAPLLIRARTYNTAASGTYGVALPVVADDRLLSPGDTADSLWIAQSADGSTGYRTNVAVVFPDAGGGDAVVTVYDAAGNVAGKQSFTLSSAGFQQFAVGAFAGAVAVGRAQIVVTRGRATAYAVVVDNVTGDSSLFSFEDLPAGPQDVLVNGVARANGRNGTFFRTDARLYNPANVDATISVAFHANQNANPSPATATFVVPAGQIRDVVDVLASLLSLPVGSAGALRFTSAAPVAILCRTSNVDPSGASPGTYGAQQKPRPLLALQSSADAGAVVTGIRQGAAFRTNVGFAAGAEGASWSLALKNAAGATVGSGAGSLGAWGWTQPNVQDLFPGVTVPDDATLLVTVSAGSLDVFDSSIDNASGDPVVTPIMPLPAAIPSSATIGPGGGSIRSSDGRLTLKIPAGALASNATLSIALGANGAPHGRGSGYVISPAIPALSKPALFALSYGRADTIGSGADSLGLAYPSGPKWFALRGGAADTGSRTLLVPLPVVRPSAVSAGRVAMADTPVPVDPFADFEITPTHKTLVAGARVVLTVFSVGGSSTDPGDPAALTDPSNPSNDDFEWFANGVLDGNPSTGKIAEQNPNYIVTYTAPATVPSENPVTVLAKLHAIPGVSPGKRLPALVTVFPRDWAIEIREDNKVPCGGFAYEFGSKARAEFSLTDDGSITNPRAVPLTDGTDGRILVQPSPCIPTQCSLTLATSFTVLQIEPGSISAYLNDEEAALTVLAHWISTATPAITVACPMTPPATQAEEPGKDDYFGPVPLGPKGDENASPGSPYKFCVRPKEIPCGS
jgi:hypothetical protein